MDTVQVKGQAQVQAGAGQVGAAEKDSAGKTQVAGETMTNTEGRGEWESGGRQQASEQVWEMPDGGMDSSSGEQGPRWRAEDNTATETSFRSLSRKR